MQWPNSDGSVRGRTSDKVPTELAHDGEHWKWGFEIGYGQPRHQWFKFGLDPAQEKDVSYLTINYPDPRALPPAYDLEVSPARLRTEYLICLREHTLRVLKSQLGQGVLDTTPLRFVITVPAIWNEAAKAQTLQCAVDASLGSDIRIVSEPEAAVVHAFDAMDPHDFRRGDTFVLCDAGGGTVDLIFYSLLETERY